MINFLLAMDILQDIYICVCLLSSSLVPPVDFLTRLLGVNNVSTGIAGLFTIQKFLSSMHDQRIVTTHWTSYSINPLNKDG